MARGVSPVITVDVFPGELGGTRTPTPCLQSTAKMSSTVCGLGRGAPRGPAEYGEVDQQAAQPKKAVRELPGPVRCRRLVQDYSVHAASCSFCL